MPTYGQLSIKHPSYDAMYWRRCRALYAGGRTLLNDKPLMRDVFPKHLNEKPEVYEERLKRAYYIPYAGQIIDFITASLFGQTITMESEPKADDFYQSFYDDCSPPNGKSMTFTELLKSQLTTALICKRAWTLIDLPKKPAEVAEKPPASALEEEKQGLLNAYACPVDPECVWDWEETEDGRLLWALIHYTRATRRDVTQSRDLITEEWVELGQKDWKKYAITYSRGKEPNEKDEVALVSEGLHSFGEVPLLPFELSDGLWAMGKIEPVAVAHLNKRNALSWAEYKSLFPVMTHFAQPPDPLNPITDDPNRMLNQTVGQGHVLQLGDKDDLRYVGPDSAPFNAAMADISNLRDEMHRVLHHMALSVDNSAAALQRSAESKQVDQSATAVVLKAFGQLIRDYAVRIFSTVSTGRLEPDAYLWSGHGMEKFDEMALEGLVSQAQTLELVSIPSATYQQRFKYILAKRLLGDAVDEDDLAKIKKELEENINNEQYGMAAMMTGEATDSPPAKKKTEPDSEEDDDDYYDDEEDELGDA